MVLALNNLNQQARVLIVEDDPLQVEVLSSLLIAVGYEVDSVSSGLDAVREIRPSRYDVILVDYWLGEINGLAVAELVSDFMGQAIRPGLIALTATPEHLNARESEATSAFFAIISKSSELSLSLLPTITRCLESAPDSATRHEAESALLRKDWLEYEAEPSRPGTPGEHPGPPRILVVEDDECQQLLLGSALEHRGYIVETLSNGLEAFRKIRTGWYDLALIDYKLPEMDGLAIGTLVLDLMQEHVRPRLIALTAAPAQLNEREARLGSVFDVVIGKSSDLHELMNAVDRLLRCSPNPITRRSTDRISAI